MSQNEQLPGDIWVVKIHGATVHYAVFEREEAAKLFAQGAKKHNAEVLWIQRYIDRKTRDFSEVILSKLESDPDLAFRVLKQWIVDAERGEE